MQLIMIWMLMQAVLKVIMNRKAVMNRNLLWASYDDTFGLEF